MGLFQTSLLSSGKVSVYLISVVKLANRCAAEVISAQKPFDCKSKFGINVNKFVMLRNYDTESLKRNPVQQL